MDWFLTWLWHGVALALVVAGGLRLCRRVSASARYVVWWAALAGVLALGWTGAPATSAVPAAAVRSAGAPAGGFALTLPPVPAWLETSLVMVWIVVAAIGLGRLVGAMVRLRQQRRTCRPISSDGERRLPLWRSARDLGRRTRLMVSDAAPVASVLGFVRPVIVLPRRLLASVTDHELDQIVLHEHAHVQRYDDWSRLAQAIIEALCPFHPAVRRIGRSLDLEREIACDEWVVARTRAPRAYARCLTRIAEWTMAHPARAIAPGIQGTGHTLVPRVARLLAPRPYASRATSRMVLAAGVTLVVAGVVQLRLLPPLIAERAGRATFVVEHPDAAVSLVADAGPRSQVDRRPAAQSSTKATVAAPVAAPAAPAVTAATAAPAEPLAQTPAEAPAEAAAPLLPSTTLTPPAGSATGLVSSGEASWIDPLGPAVEDFVDRAVLDSRRAWQEATDAGIARGARAQESSLAVASALTRLGRSLGRAF
jgi:beta-lactamase regulating signal transducer with metallopeptidase domain